MKTTGPQTPRPSTQCANAGRYAPTILPTASSAITTATAASARPQRLLTIVPSSGSGPFRGVASTLWLPGDGDHRTRVAAIQRLARGAARSEEHTSELQSLAYLVCRLLLEK